MFKLTRFVISLLFASSALCAAAADVFPVKPVRLVVSFTPGGTLDIVARLVAAKLQENWGQSVIIENRIGANGALGIEYVVRSTPDGHTLLYNGALVVATQQLQRTTFDINRDLVGVAQTTEYWHVLAAHTKTGVSTIGELFELARKQPGRLNYGSGGTGSSLHLYMERLKNAAKIDITHIPYKGSAPAMQALMVGEVDMVFDTTSGMLPLIKSGKVRPLMVTGDKRLENLPNVPIMDSVIPGIGTDAGWHGIFAPAGTPREIVNKIATDVRAAVLSPDLSARFREMEFKPTGLGPERFADIVKNDYERWSRLIRENNIRAD